MKNRKDDYEDDGRTIADMNVDGMPWYEPRRQDNEEKPDLSPAEQRALIGSALKAALLVAAIFGTVYFLFILFCTNVWFA